jgi:hypothetical protein
VQQTPDYRHVIYTCATNATRPSVVRERWSSIAKPYPTTPCSPRWRNMSHRRRTQASWCRRVPSSQRLVPHRTQRVLVIPMHTEHQTDSNARFQALSSPTEHPTAIAPLFLAQGGTKTGNRTEKRSLDNGSNNGGDSGFSAAFSLTSNSN